MANLGFDGFDHYNAAADFLSRSDFIQWQNTTSAGTLSFVTGLTGYGKAVKIVGGNFGEGLLGVFGARNQHFFFGQRVFCLNNNISAYGFYLHCIDSLAAGGAADQFKLRFDENNYAVEVWNGTTLLGTSANNVWAGDVSNFIEIELYVATGTSGYVNVWVNNVQVLALSGITTQQSANAWVDSISYQPSPVSGGGGSYIILDDFYYNDTTSGPGLFPMNGRAGDSRTSTQFATGNDVVQFAPLANANWQEISEVAMDGDASYNYDNNAGDQDTFVFQPLLATLSTIYALRLTYATRNDGAGSRTTAGVVKIGGTSYVYGSPNSVPASANYVYFSNQWTLSPATGLNFTRTEVNGADFGYKLVS
jgi:hypothetical protein